MNPLFFENLLSYSRFHIHKQSFSRKDLNQLFLSWIHYEFTIFREFTINFSNSLYIHNLFREFIIHFSNSLSFSRIHCELTFFFAFTTKFTINMLAVSQIHCIPTNCYDNPPSFSKIHYEFTVCFTNSCTLIIFSRIRPGSTLSRIHY